MRPEIPRWPPIERLLPRLPAGVPVGALERKRIEIVLRAAGVPAEREGFAAWVEREPARLARMIAAVVGVAASHPAVVREVVEVWWEEERSRRRGSGGDEDVWSEDEDRGDRWPRVAQGEGPRVWPWRVVMAVAVLAMLLLVAWWRWGARFEEWLGLQENGLVAMTSEGVTDTGDVVEPEGLRVEETTGHAGPVEDTGDESMGDSGEPPSTDDGYEVPSLENVYVRVPVASLEVVPGEPRIPWSPLVIAVLAGVGFVSLLLAKPPASPLPAPPEQAPRTTRWGRVPPRGRPQRRILLERGDRDALVWGIAREAADRLTDEVDVPRSVDETIETGIPTLCFLPASEYRGVWIWRDTEMGQHAGMAVRLEKELESALRDAGLPVQVAAFEGVPRVLSSERRRLAAAALVGVGRPPRVVVLTDAERLARRLRDASTRDRAERLLRLLRRWDGLALVDFDGPRSELAVLARAWGLRRITPDQAAAHLAGQASRVEHVAAARDLLRWEAACVVAPRSMAEDEAQRLRQALGLEASAFDIDALRECASAGRGGSRLDWSRSVRAEIFDRFERAHGYLEGWARGSGGARLLGRAVDHWLRLYDQAIAAREEGDPTDTAAHLEMERAMVRLWREPNEAARVLLKWWQTEALRGTVEELVSRYTDAEGEHVDGEGRAVYVRLPWVCRSLEPEVVALLVRMGFGVRRVEVKARRGGRWALGVGGTLGIGVAALGVGAVDVVRPQVEGVEQVGKVPEGASVECEVASGWLDVRVECSVPLRWLGPLSTGDLGRMAGPVRVEVSWVMEEQSCEGPWGSGAWYVMCDRKGRLARPEKGSIEWSEAVITTRDGRAIAQRLLDSGTVDFAVVVEAGDSVALGELGRVDGPGQRLVIVGEGVEVEGIDQEGSGVIVRVAEGWVPSLEFAGMRTVEEAWPEVRVEPGSDGSFEVRGTLTPTCPEGMRYIEGGSFEGNELAGFCLDVTEVTVEAYEACVTRGTCTASNDGGSCNFRNADRLQHPINCVDWEQAKAFCEVSGGRLPTSEEWEWAARGRDERDGGRTYPWGEEAPTCERVVMSEGGNGCGEDRTWPVGSKPQGDSRDGVKDIAGNVWEWTSTESGKNRIVRGGSWSYVIPGYFRASFRSFDFHPAYRDVTVGFRCARTIDGVEPPARSPSPIPQPNESPKNPPSTDDKAVSAAKRSLRAACSTGDTRYGISVFVAPSGAVLNVQTSEGDPTKYDCLRSAMKAQPFPKGKGRMIPFTL